MNGDIVDVGRSVSEGVMNEDSSGHSHYAENRGEDESGGDADDGVSLIDGLFRWIRGRRGRR